MIELLTLYLLMRKLTRGERIIGTVNIWTVGFQCLANVTVCSWTTELCHDFLLFCLFLRKAM